MGLIEADAVEKITWEDPHYHDPLNVLTEVREKVRALPTVNPWEVVYEELAQIPLFCGTYDAKNGSKEFVHGVSTVMESIAMKAGKQEEFDEMFLKNILKSKRKEE